MTMGPLLPNIGDFIAHVSLLNTLSVEAQNAIARSFSISYLALGETLPFNIMAKRAEISAAKVFHNTRRIF